MFCIHFIAFLYIFGTNLLKRCHSATSYFLLFFLFRKVIKEISSELDENQWTSIFHRNIHGVRRRAREAPGGALTRARRGPTPGCVEGWCGPLGCPPIPPLRLYNPPAPKTLSTRVIFHEKFQSRRRRQTLLGRVPEALPGTVPEGRSSPEIGRASCRERVYVLV